MDEFDDNIWFLKLSKEHKSALREFYSTIVDMSEENFQKLNAVLQPIVDEMNNEEK